MAAGQAGRVRGSLPWICAALIVLAHVALIWGLRFPAGNEPVYMASLAKSWDASFLAGDWTFGGGFHERAIFNALFGPLCAVAPIAAVTWIGRIVFWLLSVRALLRIASRLGAPPLLAAAALVAWLLYDQALVGEAWAIGTFESKCVAFWLAFEGIVAALDDRTTRAAFLAGAAFTIPAIGLRLSPRSAPAAGAAAGRATYARRRRFRRGRAGRRPPAIAPARTATRRRGTGVPGAPARAAPPRPRRFPPRRCLPRRPCWPSTRSCRPAARGRLAELLLAFRATVAAIFAGGAAPVPPTA
jgi:hypothetical protein